MARMRAVQVTSANGPFELVERDIPEPGDRHVRVKVQACGVCHSDSITKMACSLASNIPASRGMRWWA
jgi:D-arabinose 1-dehydrogenase-like Zn-dependent alcohol dehydrogenase